MRSFRRELTSLVLLSLGAAFASACGTSDTASPGGSGGGGGAGGEDCGNIVLNGKGGILPPPDGAALCPAGACNYQTQTGCPDDQACRPYYTASSPTITPRCEAIGSGRADAVCTSNVDCDRGYLCLKETTTVSKCRKQCCGGDWSACDAGESCIRQSFVKFANVEEPVYAVDFCVPVNNCDLFDPKSCDDFVEADRECKIVDPTGAVACSPKSSAQLGDSCAPPVVCAQGLTCIGKPGSGQICRRLCRTEECAEPMCPTEEGSCVHFDRDPPGVGECTIGR